MAVEQHVELAHGIGVLGPAHGVPDGDGQLARLLALHLQLLGVEL